MYKRNSLVVAINFLLFLLTTIILKNSIIQLLLLIILFCLTKYQYKLLKKAFITLAFINIFCGKLIFLISIILLIVYVQLLLKTYCKKDIINNYINILSKNKQKSFIKFLYFKEYFTNNYKKINYLSKELGYNKNINLYFYNIVTSYQITMKKLNELLFLYEKRFFFNKNKTNNEIEIDKNDINSVLIYCIILICTIIFWRSKYAIFI